MKILISRVLKLIPLALIVLILLLPQSTDAQRKKKKRKKEPTIVNKKPEKPKKKSIANLVKSSKELEGLFKIYQDTITGSLQMLIREDQINKEYIYFTQISNGVFESGRFRGAYGGSKVIKIKKYFNKIEFVTQNTSYYFDSDNAISASQDANMSEGNMASLKVEVFDKKKQIILNKSRWFIFKRNFFSN